MRHVKAIDWIQNLLSEVAHSANCRSKSFTIQNERFL